MDSDSLDDDGLDAFFDAADTMDKTRVHLAAEKMRRGVGGAETDKGVPGDTAAPVPDRPAAGEALPPPRRNTAARRTPDTPRPASASATEEIDPEIEKIAATLVELVDEIHSSVSNRTIPADHTAPDKTKAPSAVPDEPLSPIARDNAAIGLDNGAESDPTDDEDDDDVPPWLAHPTNVPTPSAAFSAVPPSSVGIDDARSDERRPNNQEDSDSARLLLDDLEGKFIAIAPEDGKATRDEPFILVPANVHSVVPWWGWLTIVLGLAMLVAGVILMPLITLNRTAARLGDRNENAARNAMRQLVLRGDERTVKKLYSIASAPDERVDTRLRAIDTMTLIERVPEVDRALLRLELSDSTHDQVREAAIAARRQREAARARTRQRR
ncbi:MAG: hypothetical protein LIQ31_16200 [Planctomycetes bacterium]|nr:hypothetical protein [Planctomycetota bacterium]